MDFDDDDEYGDNETTQATSATQRRRAQRAVFESWLTSSRGQQAITAPAKDKAKGISAESENDLTMEAIMNRSAVIAAPRDYQLELFERAKQENTIAVLDTGSGKTLIAVLLLRWAIDQELERVAAGHSGRVSFFIVDSVTLAYQQFSVLESNLDHKTTRICGNDNPDSWPQSTWDATFQKNRVIVCTADVLLQCLSRSHIAMKDINLLIFDEAHHAKKNHPYARIIKDFYLAEADESLRPRVLGMTASPIDAKGDVIQATSELEALLHSKIATTLHMSLTHSVNKPAETILKYAALPRNPATTPMLQELCAKFEHVAVLKTIFEEAKVIGQHLGGWCADQYVRSNMSSRNDQTWERVVSKAAKKSRISMSAAALELVEADVKKALAFVDEYPRSSKIADADMSSKVRELQHYLHMEFERPSNHRCIVFVEQRHTARLLADLFKKVGTKHMQCAYLVGAGSEQSGEYISTFKTQVVTLHKFRQGVINCLFATSVAEEGLDVPDCNLVVRFDIYKTMIQYVQSRGRARERNSRFIHMLEAGNLEHEGLARDVRIAEAAMRKVCQSLPEDRKLVGNSDTLEALLSKEQVIRTYTDPESGAKLTYGNCLTILANFTSAIPTETDEVLHPSYAVTRRGPNFIAEVVLPGSAPMRSKIGREHTKKMLAKRAAAFDACIELREKKYLDEHLLPCYQRRLPAMRNALLASNLHKKNQYDMRVKPSVWADGWGVSPEKLWITAIDFPDGLLRKHCTMAFLTRTQMPEFPSFPIFLNNGRPTSVVSTSHSESFAVDHNILHKLSAFTLRVFKDIFSKTYEEDHTKFSYWLAPLAREVGHTGSPTIDWKIVDEVVQTDYHRWTPNTPEDFLDDKFIVDLWDGSRKFYSEGIVPNMKPRDSVPEGVAKAKFGGTILNYSVSLYKNAREKAVWVQDQPVMKAERILTRRNLLATPGEKEVAQRTLAYLCPEPLRISTLPNTVVASCLIFPAVLHRFESYLIALEACEMVGIVCPPSMALAAVTKDSDNSGDHEESERINFQHGMGDNYERLEFIGDTFLKTATTISTFIQNPNDDEFSFHVKRMLLLCNKNLFKVGVDLKLHEYIRSKAFSRRLWYPEGLKLLEGKGAKKEKPDPEMDDARKHTLGQKTIADVCEALIGAAFVTGDKLEQKWVESHWHAAVHAVTKLVGSEDHMMETWDDYRKAYSKPEYQLATPTASHRDLASKVEAEHAYHFRYPTLLRSAFKHPSEPKLFEAIPNYQRLEFLGDALLDIASITHLFCLYPEKDPQWLTEHKMAMVSNKFLGAVCVNIGFYKHLRYAASYLESQIREYATELLEAKATSNGSPDYWTTVSDPPKCLPDIVEAYVGAMFIDSDFDYSVVQTFFNTHMRGYFDDMSIYDSYANNHPCTHFYKLLQTTYGCQDYTLMARELPSADGMNMERKDIVAVVIIHNDVVAYSKGKSGRYARLRVANEALEIISGLPPAEFRKRFGCNCHLVPEAPA